MEKCIVIQGKWPVCSLYQRKIWLVPLCVSYRAFLINDTACIILYNFWVLGIYKSTIQFAFSKILYLDAYAVGVFPRSSGIAKIPKKVYVHSVSFISNTANSQPVSDLGFLIVVACDRCYISKKSLWLLLSF